MDVSSRRLIATAALGYLGAAAACGGNSGAPTEPSTGSTTPIVSAYVGSVALPGGTGLLVVRAASSVNTATLSDGFRLLEVLRALIEQPLRAQGSTASGALTLDNGDVVDLTGTHSAGAFQLSASGGYSASVSASNGALSGTVSTPAGSATVMPLLFPPAPPASSPAGFYRGDYDMTVDGYYTTTHVVTGSLIRDCSHRLRISGSVRLEIFVPSWDPNALAVHILDDWREVSNVDPNCPSLAHPAERTIAPPGELGLDYAGDLRMIQAARVDRNTGSGSNARSHVFWAAVTSPTTIEAHVAKSFRFVGDPAGGTWLNSEGYAHAETTFILHKGAAPN